MASAKRSQRKSDPKHVGQILTKLGLQDKLQVGLFVARNPLILRPLSKRR